MASAITLYSMEYYIEESAQVLLANLRRSKELTAKLVRFFSRGHYSRIDLIASGSSYNACCAARDFMRKYLSLEIRVFTPFTYEHYEMEKRDGLLPLVISQSGSSLNSLQALCKMKEYGLPAIALTGNLNSDIKDYADLVIEYGVGSEKNVYVTKGVVTLMEFLMLFSLEAAVETKRITEEVYKNALEQIEQAAGMNRVMYEKAKEFCARNYKALTSMHQAYVCGCGPNFGTALEGALKIGETIKVPTGAYEVEEFLHGPNIQLTPSYTVFLIAAGNSTNARISEIYLATTRITDRVFLITNDQSLKGKQILTVPEGLMEEVSPLYHVVLFQYLADRPTTDLVLWKEHPLFDEMEAWIHSKSPSYEERRKQEKKI